jgi:PPM family protein phosphatase
LGRDLFVSNVGDSRAYLLREGNLHQLTRDHTCAQELLDMGLIQTEDLATHRLRNRLTKLLGDQVEDARPDVQRLSLENNDCLLVCTDGLTEMVNDAAIADILGCGLPADETCNRLIEEALKAGGKDNVTVIVARYDFSAANM